ncbi:MAG: competence/damage-inducible protein A [Actinobacteria bacterium]|nr:competence/damage-inducible protein A [Actinomycetota bacterium]
MRCEVLAVGTELLLGQIVDTNSAWIGEELARAGIETYRHVRVGDNQARIVDSMRSLLASSDALIVCGGLGPTPDDVTREAIAEVMNVDLHRDPEIVEFIRALFGSRGREMSGNNERQADVPEGATVIPNPIGTAPGLRCPIGHKVVYAVPGVPYEMQLMMTEHVLPDLLERSGERATIRSRTLKTWGVAESTLAEMIGERVDVQTNPTIAFLARGIEGIAVRVTAKAASEAGAQELLEAEEVALRAILGDLVFAADDETMESVVLGLLRERGLTLGIAESLTGGLVGARICNVPGASDVFRGAVVSYSEGVKRSVLGVTAATQVSEECARQMAEGARKALDADVGLSTTGVAGPDPMDGEPPGVVYFGMQIGDAPAEAVRVQLPGDRERVRQFSAISLLSLLRTRLAAIPPDSPTLPPGG